VKRIAHEVSVPDEPGDGVVIDALADGRITGERQMQHGVRVGHAVAD